MALRKAVVALAERFVATAAKRSSSVTTSEATRRVFSSWQLAHIDYPQSGVLASASPWTYDRRSSQQPFFPWSLQDMHRQPLLFSSAEKDDDHYEDLEMDVAEAKKVMMQVNAVALKKRLKSDLRDSFSYQDLLALIKESRVAINDEEAVRFARILDEAGVVLIFRENVYLHPERVAKMVSNALPFAVVPPNDPRRQELLKLEEEKGKLDVIAHRQVRIYLWTILAGLTFQVALFFRLTFWELSWDVMEPIAFFVTSAGLVGGYTYFLITARDPSYRDFMKRLFVSKQTKTFKKHNFDYLRYQLLRRQCQCLDPDDDNKSW